MATIFARSIILPRYTHSARLSPESLLQLNQLPEHRRARFHASRSLLAELMYMFHGYPQLPSIAVNLCGRPGFIDRNLPSFSISYAGNMVGVALCHQGQCGLSIALPHNPLALTGLSGAPNQTFSRSETIWINNQHNTLEARTQLTALRHSLAKLNGQREFDEQHCQLLPGAGRVRTDHMIPIEALCDVEDVLVWAVSATPALEVLQTWSFCQEHGWRQLSENQSANSGKSERIMRFTSMLCEKSPGVH